MNSNTKDSNIEITQNLDSNPNAWVKNSKKLESKIQETYHEVLISIECKQQYIQDIITQSIADIILEYDDGVEFMEDTKITLECSYNS